MGAKQGAGPELPFQAVGNALQICSYRTGHSVANVAFCDTEERAAAIVRACNAHDDLVEIVEALVNKSEFPGGVWPSWLPFDEEHCRKLIAGAA